MVAPVLLLGAGASIDSGIPGAYDLTTRVYDSLRAANRDEARLYGFVIGKIITSRSRVGVSPFAPIGIEDVYAALKRFIDREEDILSEFVHSWDDFEDVADFDAAMFHRLLSKFVKAQVTGERRYAFGSEGPGAYIRKTLGKRSSDQDAQTALRPFIEQLIKCLTPNEEAAKLPHMELLVQQCQQGVSFVGSLNYDLVFEDACRHHNAFVDTGLSDWNDKKVVRFYGSKIRLAKLHGSVDWYQNGDDIETTREINYRNSQMKRGMIFGGQSEKLVSDGPYLQLRHEFEIALRKSNKLGIIGYSFQDEHLNSLLRVWYSTRRKAKLVILDPGPVVQTVNRLFPWMLKERKTSDKVDIVHVSGTAKQKMQRFFEELESDPVSNKADERIGVRTV